MPGLLLAAPTAPGWWNWGAEKCCTGYGKATEVVMNMGKYFSPTLPQLELQPETLEGSFHNNN